MDTDGSVQDTTLMGKDNALLLEDLIEKCVP